MDRKNNRGKICIPAAAKTAAELVELAERARELADVVEIRFDHLDTGEIPAARAAIAKKITSPVITTFRSKEQGGPKDLSMEERKAFWNSHPATLYCDIEEDIFADTAAAECGMRICSFHDFEGGCDIGEVAERLAATDAGILKIAVQTDSVTDAIPLWHFLKKAVADGREAIPVAMGEAGKWTRILGPAHGAFLTFASLETGSETAPGQISARDMIDTFRVKELRKETEVFGIIAGNTSYSTSPWMHNAAFKHTGMDRVFVPLQIRDPGEFISRMVRPSTRELDLNFGGFSVTNPHKQEIIKYLDEIDPTAKAIGAVNTIKVESGRLHGWNTDAFGFIAPLLNILGDIKGSRAAVIGAGGAARACVHSLIGEGSEVTVFARDESKARKFTNEFGVSAEKLTRGETDLNGIDIVVNATPLGTKGEFESQTIADAEQLRGVGLVYDLVYNPFETQLLKEAKKAGVHSIGGMEMVIAQGGRQFEIWTGKPAPIGVMEKAVRARLGI